MVFSRLVKLLRVDVKLTRREEWRMGKGVYRNGLEVEGIKGDAGDKSLGCGRVSTRASSARGALKAHTFLLSGLLLVGGEGSACTSRI